MIAFVPPQKVGASLTEPNVFLDKLREQNPLSRDNQIGSKNWREPFGGHHSSKLNIHGKMVLK